jgi:hypothetical protein
MRRRKKIHNGNELSLVPMADMLTNVVGILIFLLIFTVLTGSGVISAKKLPMEKDKTDKKAFFILCQNGKLLPLNNDSLTDKFLEPLGRPTYYTASEWVETFNKRKIDLGLYTLGGEGEANFNSGYYSNTVNFSLSLVYTPKEGVGDSLKDMKKKNSALSKMIKRCPPDKYFIYFFIPKSDIKTFRLVREYMATQNYTSSWSAVGDDCKIRFTLTGGGTSVVDQ